MAGSHQEKPQPPTDMPRQRHKLQALRIGAFRDEEPGRLWGLAEPSTPEAHGVRGFRPKTWLGPALFSLKTKTCQTSAWQVVRLPPSSPCFLFALFLHLWFAHRTHVHLSRPSTFTSAPDVPGASWPLSHPGGDRFVKTGVSLWPVCADCGLRDCSNKQTEPDCSVSRSATNGFASCGWACPMLRGSLPLLAMAEWWYSDAGEPTLAASFSDTEHIENWQGEATWTCIS